MMRYLEYDFLKDHGLQHFDNWVSTFGDQKTDWELKPAGNGMTAIFGLGKIIKNIARRHWRNIALFQRLPLH